MNRPLAHPLQQTDFTARFAAAEFVRMVQADVFDTMRVELVGGRLERMNPAMSAHGRVHGDVCFELRNSFDRQSGHAVFIATAIAIDDDTVFAGNVVVARPTSEENDVLQAEEVLLVAEVSASTLGRDTGTKRLAYAAAGIPHYWVIDAGRRVTHVYAEPVAADYVEGCTVRFGQPLAVPSTERTIMLG